MSPYNFVANNPIVYVDPDGQENVIYLVIALDKNGKPSIDKETAEKIVAEANKIYEKLGVATRVTLTSNEPFNPRYMDKTDAVAVVGQTKEQVVNYIDKYISKTFASRLKDKNFIKSENNPEISQNDFDYDGNKNKGGNIIAVGADATKSFYKNDLPKNDIFKIAFTVVHGSGHNSGYDHDFGIMRDGNEIYWSKLPIDLEQLTSDKINNMENKQNEDLINAIKKRFGTKVPMANYGNNKNKHDNFVEKHGEEKGEKLYKSYENIYLK